MRRFIAIVVIFLFALPSVIAQPQALTTGVEPSFNSDGSMIAYASAKDGYRDIFVIDGVDRVTRLTSDIHWDGHPTFTPDGRVVFISDRTGNRELWSVDLDGRNLLQLTESSGWKSDPSVSAAGKIAFTSGRHPNLDIYVLEDGVERRLTYLNDEIHSPVWSPDGAKLAFVKEGDLMVINADGSGLEKIASGVYTRGLSWSDDGRILYLSRNVGYDLWSIDASRPDNQKLIYEGVTDSWEVNPAIDGRGKIAFSTDKDGYYRIYVIDILLTIPAPQPALIAAPVIAPAPATTPVENTVEAPEPAHDVSERVSDEKALDNLDSTTGSELKLPESTYEGRDEIVLPEPDGIVVSNPALPVDGFAPSGGDGLQFFILASFALAALLLDRLKSRIPKTLA